MFDLIRRIGSPLEILSGSGVRYTGMLSSYDPIKQTITLAKVRSFGSEDRPSQIKIQASTQIYEYIMFKLVNILGVKDKDTWLNILTEEPLSSIPSLINNASAPESQNIKKSENTRRSKRPRKTEKSDINTGKESFKKNIIIPDEAYDFDKNNKELEKDKGKLPLEHKKTYNPSFFYDSLS